MMLSVKYKEEDEEELNKRMDYAKKLGLLKKSFEQFVNFFKNPGATCGVGERGTCGIIISRHGSLNLCMGSVALNGLVDANVRTLIVFLPDEKGKRNPSVRRSVKEKIMGVKVDGVRLMQVIMSTESGAYETHIQMEWAASTIKQLHGSGDQCQPRYYGTTCKREES